MLTSVTELLHISRHQFYPLYLWRVIYSFYGDAELFLPSFFYASIHTAV